MRETAKLLGDFGDLLRAAVAQFQQPTIPLAQSLHASAQRHKAPILLRLFSNRSPFGQLIDQFVAKYDPAAPALAGS